MGRDAVLLSPPGLHERDRDHCRQNKNNYDGERFKGPHSADLRQASQHPNVNSSEGRSRATNRIGGHCALPPPRIRAHFGGFYLSSTTKKGRPRQPTRHVAVVAVAEHLLGQPSSVKRVASLASLSAKIASCLTRSRYFMARSSTCPEPTICELGPPQLRGTIATFPCSDTS